MNNDRANVAVLPSLPYLLTVIAGVVVDWLWEPYRLFPEAWIGHAAGWPVVAAATLLVIWAVVTMGRTGEHPSVHKATRAIVSTGPYAYTRNPMYLSLILVYAGIVLIFNTLWPVILLPLPLLVIQYGVIHREERYLERKFGDEYARYRTKTRRWL